MILHSSKDSCGVMECYEVFLQRHHVCADGHTVQTHMSPAASVIVFHGASVLPPLLSDEERAEMRKLREAATHLMKRREEEFRSTRCLSVCVSHTPQDEFKDERYPQQSGCDTDRLTHESDSRVKPPDDQHTLNLTSDPLTSTAHDGRSARHLRSFPDEHLLHSYRGTVLCEAYKLQSTGGFDGQADKHARSDISQPMMSSGYVTNENTDITCQSSWIERETGVEKTKPASDTTDLHLHINPHSSRTGSDIINHGPVDGEALEVKSDTEVVNSLSEPDPDEGPYRNSLQNLLKKSQEYRRRQRLLRNQTRAEHAEEHSLSDKENEEFHSKHDWKTELRKAREKRKERSQQSKEDGAEEDMSTHTELCETDRGNADSESSNDVCGNPDAELHEENKDTVSPADIYSLHPSTSVPVTARSLYLSKLKPVSAAGPPAAVLKFSSIPAPKFSLSPVRSKKGSKLLGRVQKPLVKTAVCVDRESDPSHQGERRGDGLSSQNDGGAPLGRSSDQTEQITQLELNLSSLKALISDLESTLTLSQTDETENTVENSSLMVTGERAASPDPHLKRPSVVTFSETAKDCGIRLETPTQIDPQKIRLLNSIQTINNSKNLPQRGGVLTDTSNRPENRNQCVEKPQRADDGRSCVNISSISHDVMDPSGLWTQGKQLTPEMSCQDGVSRAKRRLLMTEVISPERETDRPRSSTPKALQTSAQEQVLVRDLMEEERRQQQELLQSLAVRYQFLRSVSFSRPSTGSRLEDTSTSLPPPSVCAHTHEFTGLSDTHPPSRVRSSAHTTLQHTLQCLVSPSVFCRPLLAAVVKGFLTRRLLHTERVSQLVRTIKDTQQFLLTFQHQTPVRGEFSSRHDLMLQERVTLQLRATRYELHNIIFNLSVSDRMQIISWDRELSKDRQLRRQENKGSQSRGKDLLSAATRKALERKKLLMLQRKTKMKVSPSGEERWNLVPKLCRVSKKNTSLRGPR